MDHRREHRSLLALAEKQLLIAIARRLPPWLSSDHLTILGLLAMPAAGLAFAAIPLTPWSAALVAAALAVNWFGDSLDGTLARVRCQPRPRYGYYVDHVIDLAGTAALVAGMAASGLMSPTIALALLAAYFLVSAETYLATHTVGIFRLSFAGIGPTELRILLAIGAVFVARHPLVTVAGQPALLLDVGGAVGAAGLVMVFILSAIRNTRALYLAEPLPSRSTSSTQTTLSTQRTPRTQREEFTTQFGAFACVGVLGFLLQIAALGVLTRIAGWRWLPATIVSVELAVLNNFYWHRRWTWRDRDAMFPGRRLLRFHLSNGTASIVGNAALMALLVEVVGLRPIVANVIAVAVISLANFAMADRWVFGNPAAAKLRHQTPTLNSDSKLRHQTPTLNSDTKLRHRGAARGWAAMLLVVLLPATAAAGPPAETLSAWERYVATTESRLDFPQWPADRAASQHEIRAQGESTHVPDGTISDWRGSVFIAGVTLDGLLHRLRHPGTPPPQEDVVSSRVVARDADSLRVAMRLVRWAIVTVSYDTEHYMQFHRLTPKVATARSVATRIEEIGGSDHGFLWRLHSYWRYEEVDGGVRVDLRSLTLSRHVPALVRPVAAPLVNRVARESIVRTLEALRRYFVSY
jgi:archaetidylinositol phosphate synthase